MYAQDFSLTPLKSRVCFGICQVSIWKKKMPKKVRVWYRKNRNHWYGEFHQGGKRHAKAFESKADAHLWKSYMQHKLNYEPWQGIKTIGFQAARDRYLVSKESEGLAQSSLAEIKRAIAFFVNIIEPANSLDITTANIETFRTKRKTTSDRRKKVTPETINKDIRSLRTFYNWLVENHYTHAGTKFKMLPMIHRKFIPPSERQIRDLFGLAEPTPPLHARMTLALLTGLRRSAIEKLSLNTTDDEYIDIENSRLVTLEQKTRTQMVKYLGPNTLQVIIRYIETLPTGSRKLFNEPWDGKIRFAWERIRKRAGLPKLKFHNLRNLSLSILADKGESAATLQRHAGHRSYKTTDGYIGISAETEKRIVLKIDGFFTTSP